MNYVNGNQKIFFDPNSLSLNDQVTLSKDSFKKRKWWMAFIVIGCFFLQMFPYTITQNLTPTLSSVLFIEWLGNNTILVNLVLSIGLISTAFIAPFIGNWLSKSKHTKFIFILGICLSSIGFILFGLGYLISNNGMNIDPTSITITTLVLLSLSITTQIGTLIFSTLGINYLVSKWFPQSKKGTMLGIIFMGGAVGNMWITPLVENLLTHLFINSSYLIFILFGGLSLIVGATTCLIIVKNPIPVYESTYITSIINKEENLLDKDQNLSVSPLRTFKTTWYKLFVIGFFFLAAGVGTITTQAQQTVTNGLIELNNGLNREHSLRILANMTIIYGFGCLFGNFMGGFLNDKIGIQKSFTLGFFLELIAAMSMLFSPTAPTIFPYVWGICAGLGIYIFTSSSQYMCSYLFGNKEQTKHLGVVSFPYFLGFGLFLLIDGLIVGKTGLNANNSEWFNVHTFLGHQISGLWFVVWILCVIVLIIGFLMIFTSLTVMHRIGIANLSKHENTYFAKLIKKKYGILIWIARKIVVLFSDDVLETKYWKWVLKKALKDSKKIRYYILIQDEEKFLKNKLLKLTYKENKVKNKFNKKIIKIKSNHITSHSILYYQNLSKQKLDKFVNKLLLMDISKKNNLKKFYFQNKVNKKILGFKELETKPFDQMQSKIEVNENKLNEILLEINISRTQINNDYENSKKFYKNRIRYLNDLIIKYLEEDKLFKFEHRYYHK